MDQFSNIMTNHLSNIFDDDAINKISSNISPFLQEDDLIEVPEKKEIAKTEITEEKVTLEHSSNIDLSKLKESLLKLKTDVDQILLLLEDKAIPTVEEKNNLVTETKTEISVEKNIVKKPYIANATEVISINQNEKIIEGIFNGEKMIDAEGKEYAVPPNYASKSKLVEGDVMKLTVNDNGKFIYKQIGPIPRKRIIGILEFDEERQMWNVFYQGKSYKVLTASVTFYKGKPYDEAVALIPKDGDSDWCAMENVISK